MRNKDVRRRLTGFELPVVGGGVQWETVEAVRVAARRVLAFLEDRRVLFYPYWAEEADHCIASVIDVRRMLVEEIGGLGDDDKLIPHLRAMQVACRQFLDQAQAVGDRHPRRLWVAHDLDARGIFELVVGLGELRSATGVQIGLIASAFGLDVPDTLAGILPPAPDADDEPDVDIHLRW